MAYNSAYDQPHASVPFQHPGYFEQYQNSPTTQQNYSWNEMDFTSTPISSNSTPSVSNGSKSRIQYGGLSQYPQANQHYIPADTSSISDNNAGATSYPFANHLNFQSNMSSTEMSASSGTHSCASSSYVTDQDNSNISVSSFSSGQPVRTQDLTEERMCPILTGEVEDCQPQRCGSDAPCMHFVSIPPIEECTSVPCMTSSNVVGRIETSRQSDEPEFVPPVAVAERHGTIKTKRPILKGRRASSQEDTRDVDPKQRAKQAHSLVERKYRENLNAKIVHLHSTLKDSHYGPQMADDDVGGDDIYYQNNKIKKGDVLADAIKYVHHTEVEMRHMEAEMNRLRDRVQMLERLVRCEDCSLMKRLVGLQMAPV